MQLPVARTRVRGARASIPARRRLTVVDLKSRKVVQRWGTQSQGALMADTPLTLAETASVFGEMLTFKRLLAETKDKAQRKAMLAQKDVAGEAKSVQLDSGRWETLQPVGDLRGLRKRARGV